MSALGKGDPFRESGTAYSGNFDYAQNENWIDALLNQAVDVRQRFVSWESALLVGITITTTKRRADLMASITRFGGTALL